MKLSATQSALCDRIGYRFKDPDLLRRAVSHPSATGQMHGNNQRLEFLGDRVLGLVMAQALLDADPEANEGRLAPRYNALVRKETCADVAREYDLGAALVMGRSEMMSGGRRKEALLADAMEAVIAAVYLDSGFDRAKDLVVRLWGARVHEVEDDARDAKTALQEWAQGQGQNPPEYIEKSRKGPPHAPQFTIVVRLQSGHEAEGTAGSKRRAQQRAATALLSQVEEQE